MIKSDSIMDDSKQVTGRTKRDIVVKYTLQYVLQMYLMTELQITQITQVIEHIRKWKLHTDFITWRIMKIKLKAKGIDVLGDLKQ